MPFLDETGLKRVWSKVKSIINKESADRAEAVSTEKARATQAESNMMNILVGTTSLERSTTASKAYAINERFILNGTQLCIVTKPIAKGSKLIKDSNYAIEPVTDALYMLNTILESAVIPPGATTSFMYRHSILLFDWYNNGYTPSSIPKTIPGNYEGTLHVTIQGYDVPIVLSNGGKTLKNGSSDFYVTAVGVGMFDRY